MEQPKVILPPAIVDCLVLKVQLTPNPPPLLLEVTTTVPFQWLGRVGSSKGRDYVEFIDSPLYSSSFPMKILLWNVRGAGGSDLLRSIQDLVRVHKPVLVGIMETRVGSDRAEDIVRRIRFSDHRIVEGLGFSGGIWLLWDSGSVNVIVEETSFQAITVKVKRKDEQWNFTTVYGSPTP
ncbi:Endonuclease/exonuclease/phosphatase [Corchorus capsularis]|uniref:Endonuclease/exonuclease/phosphatase n=1 Tax=Corchorus capsularis TaxID=210143 RepID=A0A1R3K7Y7_COCAP|nr:Endonuclease/exonuclease/phosphatase [Corchorus capsularis]